MTSILKIQSLPLSELCRKLNHSSIADVSRLAVEAKEKAKTLHLAYACLGISAGASAVSLALWPSWWSVLPAVLAVVMFFASARAALIRDGLKHLNHLLSPLPENERRCLEDLSNSSEVAHAAFTRTLKSRGQLYMADKYYAEHLEAVQSHWSHLGDR